MSRLNHDCLEYIFTYLQPEDWQAFAKVCKSWNEAANSKECHKFIFFGLNEKRQPPGFHRGRLSFTEFVDLLKFVAPKLRHVKFERTGYNVYENDVYVAFGRFQYIVKISDEERKIMMDIIWKQTRNIEEIKLKSVDNLTKSEWLQFVQSNRLKSFGFDTVQKPQHQTFYHDYISLLPNNLERIEFYWLPYLKEEVVSMSYQYMLNLLQRLPMLTEVSLTNAINPEIATEISKHNKTIYKLSLVYYQSDFQSILNSINIPSFTKLTQLKLGGFVLSDDLCSQIAKNCQSIRYLDLASCRGVSTRGLGMLMSSLSNLVELRVSSVKVVLTNEMKNLRKLDFVIRKNASSNCDIQLARALSCMPNLTCLTLLNRKKFGFKALKDSSLCRIANIVHSRGQNIVMYSINYELNETKKVREIPCEKPGRHKDFTIFYD